MFRLSSLGRAKRLVLGTCLGAGLCLGCGRPLTDDECMNLLTRYVELLAKSDREDTTAQQRQQMQQRAREMAHRDPEFGRCRNTVSRRDFECAMAAPSTDEFERCLM